MSPLVRSDVRWAVIAGSAITLILAWRSEVRSHR